MLLTCSVAVANIERKLPRVADSGHFPVIAEKLIKFPTNIKILDSKCLFADLEHILEHIFIASCIDCSKKK